MVERLASDVRLADELLPLFGMLLGTWTARHITGGRASIAVHVLDEDREPGELVQGLGDAGLPGVRNDLVELPVRLHDLRESRNRRREIGVETAHPPNVPPPPPNNP